MGPTNKILLRRGVHGLAMPFIYCASFQVQIQLDWTGVVFVVVVCLFEYLAHLIISVNCNLRFKFNQRAGE